MSLHIPSDSVSLAFQPLFQVLDPGQQNRRARRGGPQKWSPSFPHQLSFLTPCTAGLYSWDIRALGRYIISDMQRELFPLFPYPTSQHTKHTTTTITTTNYSFPFPNSSNYPFFLEIPEPLILLMHIARPRLILLIGK